MTRPEEHTPTPVGLKALQQTSIFVLAGVCDAALTLVFADQTSLRATLAVVALWTLFGVIFSVLQQAAWTLTLGRDGETRLGRWMLAKLMFLWRGEVEDDTQRFCVTVAALVGLGLWLATNYLMLVYLIENRHGAGLIAVTYLIGMLLMLGVSAILGGAVYRALRALARWWSRFFRMRFLMVALAAGALVGGIVIAVLKRELLSQVDALSLGLLALAVVAQPLGRWVVPGVLQARSWIAVGAALVVSFVGLPVLCETEESRLVVINESYTAKLYYSGLQSVSDFDGDNFANYPVDQDCGPFDSDIHRLAHEIPHNGVDENCDERDFIPDGYEPLRRSADIPEGPIPNLVLISIDATRADHMGFQGYKRDITPRLDAFASESTVFLQAFSNDSGTGPSFWALMSGKTPFQVTFKDPTRYPPVLSKEEKLLAELLAEAGFQTSGVLCGSYFRKWDIKRGFDAFQEVCSKRKGKASKFKLAEVVTEEAKKVLEELEKKTRTEPFFLWVHYMDPHHPYNDHPNQDLGKKPIDRYDEEIAYTDQHVAELIEVLKDQRMDPRPTLIAITADHGENFGEHGKSPHARTLYREVTHVPLVLYVPGEEGRRVEATVSNGDLYPTFLELAGVPIPEDTTQVSLAPVLYGAEPDSERFVFQENSWSRPRRHVKGIVGQGYHMIYDVTSDTTELYDLEADPGEKNNLAGQGVAMEKTMKNYLEAFIQTTFIPPNLVK